MHFQSSKTSLLMTDGFLSVCVGVCVLRMKTEVTVIEFVLVMCACVER